MENLLSLLVCIRNILIIIKDIQLIGKFLQDFLLVYSYKKYNAFSFILVGCLFILPIRKHISFKNSNSDTI